MASEDMIRQLTALADLPLTADRQAAVAELLAAWLPDANALSRKMSAPEHQGLVPATVFTHPAAPGEED